MSALDNLPPILIIPLLSRHGVNLKSFLFFYIMAQLNMTFHVYLAVRDWLDP